MILIAARGRLALKMAQSGAQNAGCGQPKGLV
jgi:hypothetical protein